MLGVVVELSATASSLNEKCGLIEWVTDTCTLKSIIHTLEPE